MGPRWRRSGRRRPRVSSPTASIPPSCSCWLRPSPGPGRLPSLAPMGRVARNWLVPGRRWSGRCGASWRTDRRGPGRARAADRYRRPRRPIVHRRRSDRSWTERLIVRPAQGNGWVMGDCPARSARRRWTWGAARPAANATAPPPSSEAGPSASWSVETLTACWGRGSSSTCRSRPARTGGSSRTSRPRRRSGGPTPR